MERKIFCPSPEMLDTAASFSKETGLMIQIGDSHKTKNININRSIVSIIQIPETISLSYQKEIKIGYHQKIVYINDFEDSKKIKLMVNEEIIKPLYTESYKNKYLYHPQTTGVFSATIWSENRLLEDFEFSVY